MFARITFLPSLGLNVALERLTSRRWWDRIDSTVVLGALPFRGTMTDKLIAQERIGAVVSMNESYELAFFSNDAKAWKQKSVNFLQLPTVDIFESPSQDKLRRGVEFIINHKASDPEKTSVYVHCKAGRTRSATLVACYLIAKYGYRPEDAVACITAVRPHIWLHTAQWDAIQRFYEDPGPESQR